MQSSIPQILVAAFPSRRAAARAVAAVTARHVRAILRAAVVDGARFRSGSRSVTADDASGMGLDARLRASDSFAFVVLERAAATSARSIIEGLGPRGVIALPDADVGALLQRADDLHPIPFAA